MGARSFPVAPKSSSGASANGMTGHEPPWAAFTEAALARAKRIDCFGFVPSQPHALAPWLEALPPGRFCEWGSGIGIGTAIATYLGHQAIGIELNAELAAASRELHRDFDLAIEIHEGSMFEIPVEADYYFAYPWPGQMAKVQEHFLHHTPAAARLLIAHGHEDIRSVVKRWMLADQSWEQFQRDPNQTDAEAEDE